MKQAQTDRNNSCTHCGSLPQQHSNFAYWNLVLGFTTAGVVIIANFLQWLSPTWQLYIFLATVLWLGYPVFVMSFHAIKAGNFLDENFLMIIATLGAFYLKEYSEGLTIIFFYRIGMAFENMAEKRSNAQISSLLAMQPTTIRLKQPDGSWLQQPVEMAQVDQEYQLLSGECNGVDGIVISGEAWLDTAAITGESVPVHAKAGDNVLSGMIIKSGTLHLRVDKPAHQSSLQRILQLVQQSADKKSTVEQFIRQFSHYYTPAVIALCIAVLLLGSLVFGISWTESLKKTIILLVISCPCALVISIPMSFFAAIGRASQLGFLVKGGKFITLLAKAKHIIFDKTGTLTNGIFNLQAIYPAPHISETDLIAMATSAEMLSQHPLALALQDYAQQHHITIHPDSISQHQEIAGKGLQCLYQQQPLLLGNLALMQHHHISVPTLDVYGSVIYVVYQNIYQGALVFADAIFDNSAKTITALQEAGLHIHLLSGDRQEPVSQLAKTLGITQYYAQLLPEDKLNKVQRIAQQGKTIFVGDGLNDLPALATAHMGIAMGKGVSGALETADAVLFHNDPFTLVKAYRLAKQTQWIVWQNIIVILSVKLYFLSMGVVGHTNIWQAVFADTGLTVLAVLNAMRIFGKGK